MAKQGGVRNTGRQLSRFLAPWLMEKLIVRLGLSLLKDSLFIYGGDCPFCGGERTFVVWVNRRSCRCSKCGLDGWFGPAPELERGEREEKQAALAEMVA
jgi:Zn ribbon nucleic-acid-binding protein